MEYDGFVRALRKEGEENWERLTMEYELKQRRLLIDPEFGCYLFGFCTFAYLNGINDNLFFIHLGIDIRYKFIPESEGHDISYGSEWWKKRTKYYRDTKTARGTIKILARETPCKCMDDLKKRAMTMEKVAECHYCCKQFPKKDMFYCACRQVTYCSKNCQLKDWSRHKANCINAMMK